MFNLQVPNADPYNDKLYMTLKCLPTADPYPTASVARVCSRLVRTLRIVSTWLLGTDAYDTRRMDHECYTNGCS